MNRLLSKVFVILLTISTMATVFSGCGSSNKAASSDNAATKGTAAATTVAAKKPVDLEVTRCLYFGDASDNPDLKADFQKVFSEKFGVNLKINALPRNNYMDKVNLMVASGQLHGLLLTFLPTDTEKFISDGTILPLDDYLKDNQFWNSMPDGYKEQGVYGGQHWNVNTGYSGSAFVRSVRQDWLDKLGMQAPKTVDDLYEMAKAFTEKDPDGNGKNDTVGLTAAGTWNLQDIFQAFDARLSNTGDCGYVWDPNTNNFIDSMLKPEMTDALAYVRKLYQNGYLDKELFTNHGNNMRDKFLSGKYGSTFYWLGWARDNVSVLNKNVPEGKVTELVAITGKRTKNLNQIVVGGGSYVLLKDTPNPGDVVNTFINYTMADKDGYLMSRFGIEGKTYKVDGDRIIQIMDPTTNAIMTNPGLSSALPQYSSLLAIPEGTKEQEDATAKGLEASAKAIQDGLASGLLYNCPHDAMISDTFAKVSQDVYKIFNDAIVKSATGELTPEEALQQYKKQMKEINGDQILKELNESIGTTATQQY